jgi:peroxiredoxin
LEELRGKFGRVVFLSVNDPYSLEHFVEKYRFKDMPMVADFSGRVVKELDLGLSAEQAFSFRSKRAIFYVTDEGLILQASVDYGVEYSDQTTPDRALSFRV